MSRWYLQTRWFFIASYRYMEGIPRGAYYLQVIPAYIRFMWLSRNDNLPLEHYKDGIEGKW